MPENNQLISLNPDIFWSGCSIQHLDSTNRPGVLCSAARSFVSMRERWWFLAVSRCDEQVLNTSDIVVRLLSLPSPFICHYTAHPLLVFARTPVEGTLLCICPNNSKHHYWNGCHRLRDGWINSAFVHLVLVSYTH